jgi:hypothetical protein
MSRRALFWDEADARAVAERLADAGCAAEVRRDRFAGEDDDEDHPWAVLTAAPAGILEPLLEELDGWLDEDPPAAAPGVRPLDLPAGPRRVKGHVRDA